MASTWTPVKRTALVLTAAAALTAVSVPLTAPSAVAHPSCSYTDFTGDPSYNNALPAYSHKHHSDGTNWIVNTSKSTYGGPGAELVYDVFKPRNFMDPRFGDYLYSRSIWCPGH